MSSALAIPTPKGVQPPPNKAEVIEALAITLVAEREAAAHRALTEVESARKEHDRVVRAAVSRRPKALILGAVHGPASYETDKRSSVEVRLRHSDFPEVAAASQAIAQAQDRRQRAYDSRLTVAEARRIIREQLNQTDAKREEREARVKAILGDPKAAKALKATLSTLFSGPALDVEEGRVS